ncbi:sigma-70 family RNA polymerase sigma factor [Paenibacillus sp. FA6]|uniref:sigma-70 family RNA polymerase sigma factor n=1 Tax=Paenibacillus sp. FA6 TaxID=3413029 RepID=UPI003F65946C
MNNYYNPHLGYCDEVIPKNMGMVHSIANAHRKFINQGVDYEDLVGEGTIGLIKAFHAYDPTKFNGEVTAFSTYAFPMIKWEIQRFMRDKGSSVRVPRSIYSLVNKIYKNNLVDASPVDISERLECSLKEAKEASKHIRNSRVSSLDQSLGASENESQSVSLLDMMASKTDLSGVVVNEFIFTLEDREREITEMRLEDKSQNEIAEVVGISQVQVSRLLVRIGEKLIKYMEITESEDIKMKHEVTTRKVNLEEAKRHGVKTMLEGIEWFVDGNLPSNPTIGLNAGGLHLNTMAAQLLKCEVGNYVRVGFSADKTCLIVVKDTSGIKLRKAFGGTGSVAIINKRLVDWLDQRSVERKRYVIQHDETTDVHYIQLDMKLASGQ